MPENKKIHPVTLPADFIEALDAKGWPHDFDFQTNECVVCHMSRQEFEDNGEPCAQSWAR